MSRNQKPKADYTQALTQAKTESPVEKKRNELALRTLDWFEKGDFTNPSDGGVFINFADNAAMKKHREQLLGAGAQGVAALGADGNANLLALDKQNRADEDADAAAAQYEGDLRDGVNAAMGIAGEGASLDLQRKLGVLGATSSVYNTQQNKPRWWQSLLAAGGQVGGALAGSPAGSSAIINMLK